MVYNLLARSDTLVGLIRLSTHVKSTEEKPEEAMRRLKDFARELFPEVEAALK